MLQHPSSDYYELSVATKQTPPTFSPQGGGVGGGGGGGGGTGALVINSNNNNNNNNNSNSVNNNNNNSSAPSDADLELIAQNGTNVGSAADRESLPSFGFTQEQVACVCEVSLSHDILMRFPTVRKKLSRKWLRTSNEIGIGSDLR
uniref:Homeobox domain-containing protein n=1 Tax=Anopheles culicifacies TaxID=139723 RepID=A0A182LSL5_9DIPT